MKMKNAFKVILFLSLVTIACDRTNRPGKEGTQSNSFVGSWKFVSLIGKSTEGDVFIPYGENLYGKIMYDAGGHMSVLLMRPDRPKFASGDIYGGTPEEMKFAFENFDAYCGTYEVDVEKGTVTHRIEGCRFPNWEGTHQVRYYEFSGDTLTLSATLSLKEKEWALEAILIRL